MFTVKDCPRCGGQFRVRFNDDLDVAHVWCTRCEFAACWPCSSTSDEEVVAWEEVRSIEERLDFLRGVLAEQCAAAQPA